MTQFISFLASAPISHPVPDSGITGLLLGGAVVGIVAVTRYLKKRR